MATARCGSERGNLELVMSAIRLNVYNLLDYQSFKNWLVYLYQNTEALLEGVGGFREHYLVAFCGSEKRIEIK